MVTKKILDCIKFDTEKNRYIDCITELSFIHNSGLITARTKQKLEFSVKFDDLITELALDKNKTIIRKKATVFNKNILIKYCEKSKRELNKVISICGLYVLEIQKDPIFKTPIMIVSLREPKKFNKIEKIQEQIVLVKGFQSPRLEKQYV